MKLFETVGKCAEGISGELKVKFSSSSQNAYHLIAQNKKKMYTSGVVLTRNFPRIVFSLKTIVKKLLSA